MKSKYPSLPAKRAFVVQLRTDAQVEQGKFRGRIEQVVSYKARHFPSLEELTACIVQTVTTLQRKDDIDESR